MLLPSVQEQDLELLANSTTEPISLITLSITSFNTFLSKSLNAMMNHVLHNDYIELRIFRINSSYQMLICIKIQNEETIDPYKITVN